MFLEKKRLNNDKNIMKSKMKIQLLNEKSHREESHQAELYHHTKWVWTPIMLCSQGMNPLTPQL